MHGICKSFGTHFTVIAFAAFFFADFYADKNTFSSCIDLIVFAGDQLYGDIIRTYFAVNCYSRVLWNCFQFLLLIKKKQYYFFGERPLLCCDPPQLFYLYLGGMIIENAMQLFNRYLCMCRLYTIVGVVLNPRHFYS